jgi:hypothetical protein
MQVIGCIACVFVSGQGQATIKIRVNEVRFLTKGTRPGIYEMTYTTEDTEKNPELAVFTKKAVILDKYEDDDEQETSPSSTSIPATYDDAGDEASAKEVKVPVDAPSSSSASAAPPPPAAKRQKKSTTTDVDPYDTFRSSA